jgi:hypothetical protein
MEIIHWNIVVFIIIAVLLLVQIIREIIADKRGLNLYTKGVGVAVFIFFLIVFIAIWGGIFWW